MDGLSRLGAALLIGVALIGEGLAGALACAHPPQPVTAASAAKKASEKAPAESAAADGAPSATAAPAPAQPAPAASPGAEPAASRPGVVVVDPGALVEDNRSKGLVDAARAERERRTHAGPPVAVINNKTLPHLAKGQLTYVDPKAGKAKAPSESEAEGASATAAAGAHDEAYWRGRALAIRTRWHDAHEEIAALQQSAADLRRRFYAEDDPYRRDAQIKPEWDRALDRLAREREEATAAQRELAEFLEEGRREGALPGWLREGAELEPPPEPKVKPGDAIEPPEGGQVIEPPEMGESPP
jgi:hypothetical protein